MEYAHLAIKAVTHAAAIIFVILVIKNFFKEEIFAAITINQFFLIIYAQKIVL